MSVKVMSRVWEADGLSSTEKLLLLSLADHANDEGVCYPSVGRLMERTGLSDRGIQKTIRALQQAGWLSIDPSAGPRGCNVFTVNDPPNEVHPRTTFTPNTVREPPNHVRQTPEPRSPEPSENHQEPSKSKSARDDVRGILEQVAGSDAVVSFIAYRRKQRGKALSPTAARRLAGHLRKIFDAGGDPDDALGMAEEKGWQSVEPDWYFRAKGQQNGNGTGRSSCRAQATGNGRGAGIASIVAQSRLDRDG